MNITVYFTATVGVSTQGFYILLYVYSYYTHAQASFSSKWVGLTALCDPVEAHTDWTSGPGSPTSAVLARFRYCRIILRSYSYTLLVTKSVCETLAEKLSETAHNECGVQKTVRDWLSPSLAGHMKITRTYSYGSAARVKSYSGHFLQQPIAH